MNARSTAAALVLAITFAGCSSTGSEPTALAPAATTTSSTLPTLSVGVGSCTPEMALAGHPVDCRFPVDGDPAVLEQLHGGATAISATGERSWPCVLEDAELVCRRLSPNPGVTSIGIDLGSGDVVLDRATLTVEEASIVAFIPQLEVAPGLFAGVPAQVDVFRDEATDPVWGLVRRWPEREVVSSIDLLAAGESRASAFVVIGDPGVYDLTMCTGADATRCDPDPSGYRFQVLDAEPLDLVPGHNNRASDRINIIVTGGGFVSVDEFIAAAKLLMAPDAAAIPVGDADVVDAATARSVWFPPFAVDPLREMADRFNVWYLSGEVDYEGAQRNYLLESESAALPREFSGLTNFAFVHLVAAPYGVDVLEVDGVHGGGAASLASFHGALQPPESQESVRFGLAFVEVEPRRSWMSAGVLIHEMGHSLFGLWDEYFDTEAPGQPGDECDSVAPNVAADQAEAETWWGHLVGEVDPFYYEYRETLVDYGLWAAREQFDFDSALPVGFFSAGCGI